MPSLEEMKEYKNLLEAVSRHTDSANRRLKDSTKAITDINNFLYSDTKEWKTRPEYEIKTTKEDDVEKQEKVLVVVGVKTIYLKQYDPVHQPELTKPLLVLEHDLSGVLPVALNLRTAYYKLEPNRPPDNIMPGYVPPQQVYNKPPGFFGRFFNRIATSINDLQSPYNMALEPIQQVENIEQIFRKWLDYHNYGVIKQRRLTKERMEGYLILERKYFSDTVMVSIMKIIGEASRLLIASEQANITSIIAAKKKEDIEESKKF